jgi:hypothetical protein
MNETFMNIRNSLVGHIIPNGATAMNLFHQMDIDFAERYLPVWSRIDEEFDRKTPYDAAKLKEMNQSYRVNLNIGEMEAAICDATATATETVFSSRAAIELKLRTYVPGKAISATNYESVVAEEYTAMVSEEMCYFSFVDFAHQETMLFGFTAAVWPNEYHWKPVQVSIDRFRFPSECPVLPKEIPFFAVRRGIEIQELFRKVSTEGSAWNQDLVKAALLSRFQDATPSVQAEEAFIDLRTRWDRGDAELLSKAYTEIPVIDFYSRDPVTGGVTHMILWSGTGDKKMETHVGTLSEQEVRAISDSLEEGHILFVRPDRYESMEQALWLMTFDQGRKTLDSVKGLGRRIYPHCALSNRLFCQTTDGAIQASTIVLIPPDGGAKSKIPFSRSGSFTALQPGWTVPSTSFNPPINHLISLRSMSTSIMHNNIGNYRRRPEDPQARRDPKSATEIQSEDSRENEAEQGRAMYRFEAWDRLHKEIFRRMTSDKLALAGIPGDDKEEKVTVLEEWMTVRVTESHPDDEDFTEGVPGGLRDGRDEVIRWLARCMLRGVPIPAILRGRWKVTASRGVGTASRAARISALQGVQQMRQEMPAAQRRLVARELAAQLTLNDSYAERLFPDVETGEVVTQTISLVSLENAAFKAGTMIPPAEDQPHEDHLQAHMQGMVGALQAWQQRPNREELVSLARLLELGVQHSKIHLAYLSQDPFYKYRASEISGQLLEIEKQAQVFIQQAKAHIADQQETIQRQQAELEEARKAADENQTQLALGMRKIEVEREIEMAKTENLNQSRDAKTNTALQTNFARFQQEQEQKAQKHMAEMQAKIDKMTLEHQRMQAEIERIRNVNTQSKT